MKKVLQITQTIKPGDDLEMALDLQSHTPGFLCAHASCKSLGSQESPDTLVALFECEDVSSRPLKGTRVAWITDREFNRLKTK